MGEGKKRIILWEKNLIKSDSDRHIEIDILSDGYTYLSYRFIQTYLKKVQSKILQIVRNNRYKLRFFLKICSVLTREHIKRIFRTVNIHPCYTAGVHAIPFLIPIRRITVSLLKKKCKRVDKLANYLIARRNISISTFIPYSLIEKGKLKT